MEIKIDIPEVVDIFKQINGQREDLFEMIRSDIRETIGEYLSGLMDVELTHFLGRKSYERIQGKTNYRNGSYGRNFTLKGIGEVDINVPRDRKGEFKTHVIPRGKQYKDTLRQDLCLMFLTGISTRSLSMISKKLIGRRISAGEISNVNKELTDFYAASKKKAREFFDKFKDRWEKDLPSAVKCLDSSIDTCLTFFDYPEEEWISIRTINVIERLNKEFKRRTKSMEIVAGERACYTLLAFICLRMELHWRSNLIGKARNNLPFLKELAFNNFTQNN